MGTRVLVVGCHATTGQPKIVPLVPIAGNYTWSPGLLAALQLVPPGTGTSYTATDGPPLL